MKFVNKALTHQNRLKPIGRIAQIPRSMLVPFKTPKKLGLNIAVYHIKCKKDTVLQHLYPSSAFLGWGMTFLLIFLRNICLRSRLLENNNNNGGYVLS